MEQPKHYYRRRQKKHDPKALQKLMETAIGQFKEYEEYLQTAPSKKALWKNKFLLSMGGFPYNGVLALSTAISCPDAAYKKTSHHTIY